MLTLALAWLSSNRTTVPLAGSTRLLLQCLVTLCHLTTLESLELVRKGNNSCRD